MDLFRRVLGATNFEFWDPLGLPIRIRDLSEGFYQPKGPCEGYYPDSLGRNLGWWPNRVGDNGEGP